jgi:O-antigen/teichoic acid export membrane protein
MSVVLVGFYIVGESVIELVLGPGFAAVFSGSLVYLVGTAIAMITVGLHPAALALALPLESFFVLAVSAVVYGGALVVLVPALGVDGAAWAYVIFYSSWAVQLLIRIGRKLTGPDAHER